MSTFFSPGYGSPQPLKVLCDATFIHLLVVNGIRISPPYDAISNLLGHRALLFTTRCIMSELQSLGESHLGSFRLADTLITAGCAHVKGNSAVACIMDIIGAHNLEYFFVATMDADLRKKLREIPDVPMVFSLRNALFLEQPSGFQRTFVKSAEEGCLHMTEAEFNILDKGAKTKLATEEATVPSDAGQGHEIMLLDDLGKANATKRPSVTCKTQFKASEFQSTLVKSAQRLHITEAEFSVLDKGAVSKLAIEEARGSLNAVEGDQMLTSWDVRKTNDTTKERGRKHRAQFKKKKVKGTNSLPCLEEKSHEQPQPDVATEGVDHGHKTTPNDKKKRKRSKKRKIPVLQQ